VSALKKKIILSCVIIIVLAGFALYYNTLAAPFLFDDTVNIVENLKIRDLKNYFPPTGRRDVGYLTFALNFALTKLDVKSYHIVNIMVHVCNALLIFFLYRLLLKNLSVSGNSANRDFFVAAAISLIFLAHPVQTGAVTYIVQRFTSLATLFYILSIFLFLKASSVYSGKERFFSHPHLSYYLLSIISAVCAMKTKEITLTIPLVILMCEVFMRRGVGSESYRAKPVIYFVPFILTFFVIPLDILSTDQPLGELIGEITEKTKEAEEIQRSDYLFTQFRVVATYLRLMVLPLWQNLDYDFRLSTSFFEPGVILSFAAHLLIAGIALYIFLKAKRGMALLIPFGIFWFYITLSVESSIIPIRDVIFEHRMYLPSSGLIAAAGAAFVIGKERFQYPRATNYLAAALLFVIIMLLSALTIKRNMLWQDGFALWEDTISKSPMKSRPHANLAVLYYKRGLNKEALREYMNAIAIDPENPGFYNNLGNVYKEMGLYDNALNAYSQSVALDSHFAEGHYNLGTAFYEAGNIEKALPELKTAIRLSPELFDAHITIGNIYDDMGMMNRALQSYAKALEINPYSHMAYYNRGILYERAGETQRAVMDFNRAIDIKPDWDVPKRQLRKLGY
jgi:tetratricopeptide (TPR) repeat protein